MLFVWSAVALAADCSNDDLVVAIEAGEEAYRTLDTASFSASSARAAKVIACLDEPISPDLASAFHRVKGLEAFIERDLDGAARWFKAARALEPAYNFPSTLVPQNNPVREVYAQGDLDAHPGKKGPIPNFGAVRINGGKNVRREGLPAVFQRFDAIGQVVDSQVLAHDQPLPNYPSGKRKRRNVPLWIATGALGAASAGFSALGVVQKRNYQGIVDNPGDYPTHQAFVAEADDARSRAHLFTSLGIGTGSAAVGLGAFTIVLGVI